MRTLVFDIRGDYGLFKKAYSPMSPVSDPIPSPPAVLGLLGAILGLAKDDYAAQLGWDRVRIAIGLRAPVRTQRAALNLLQTKDGTDGYFRPRADRNTHTQVPCEFLRQPAFRLYVAALPPALAERLAADLQAGRSAYTPVLGLANCIADLAWVGDWLAHPLPGGEHQCDTALPLDSDTQARFASGRRYRRLRLPVRMDAQRIVHAYREVLIAEDPGPLTARVPADALHQVGEAHVAFL